MARLPLGPSRTSYRLPLRRNICSVLCAVAAFVSICPVCALLNFCVIWWPLCKQCQHVNKRVRYCYTIFMQTIYHIFAAHGSHYVRAYSTLMHNIHGQPRHHHHHHHHRHTHAAHTHTKEWKSFHLEMSDDLMCPVCVCVCVACECGAR